MELYQQIWKKLNDKIQTIQHALKKNPTYIWFTRDYFLWWKVFKSKKYFVFFRSFSSFSRIFQSFGNVTITGEGLQIFAFVLHLRPLSSEGSLACHAYCDTGHPFEMVISEDPWHSHLLLSVWQWSCHFQF